MTGFRYVPVSPEIIGKQLGNALELLMFLVDHQTDAAGHVFYGKPFSYKWIRSHWPGNPDERPGLCALRKRMAVLKAEGLVEVRLVANGRCGMRVRLLGSVKWSKPAPAAAQLSLLSPPPTVIRKEAPVEKAVEKQWNCGKPEAHGVPKADAVEALTASHFGTPEEVKKQADEKIAEVARLLRAPVAVQKSAAELDARHQELRRQVPVVLKKYKTSG